MNGLVGEWHFCMANLFFYHFNLNTLNMKEKFLTGIVFATNSYNFLNLSHKNTHTSDTHFICFLFIVHQHIPIAKLTFKYTPIPV